MAKLFESKAFMSGLTSFVTAFAVALPATSGELGWSTVAAAAYAALRTTVVALNPADDSYGVNAPK